LIWVAVFLLGAGLRFLDLSEAPLHADEAVGAKITAERLEGRGYSFDPSHFHGPALSWLASLSARLTGLKSFEDLDILTLRGVAALCGSLVILLPFLLRRWLGEIGALLGALLLATSPLLCFYSRVFIHEPLLALFTAAALACLGWWMTSPSRVAAVCGGIALGLMAATKETFAIAAFSWFIGLLVSGTQKSARQLGVAAAFSLVAFLAVLLAAYGNPLFFFSTYVGYATDPGHAKPLLYYWDLLITPEHRPPQWWSEAGVALLALGGTWTAWRGANPFLRLLAVSAGLQFFVYSAISYKTPWLMVIPWMQACLLAGVGASTVKHWRGLVLAGVVVFFQLQQTYAAVFRFPNDSRNPLVYSPTSSDIERLRDRLYALKKNSAAFQEGRMAVLGSSYWPLPWYLRNTIPTGYFETMPEDLETFAVVIAMPEMAEKSGQRLAATHDAFFKGLRHEVPVTVFVRCDIRAEELAAP
jgi:predicted membrane-bound mannosyltransferase